MYTYHNEMLGFGNIPEEARKPLSENEEKRVTDELRNNISLRNFDTFSSIFHFLAHCNTCPDTTRIQDVLVDFQFDSQKVTQKYNGSNCIGLSLELQRTLNEAGIRTTLIPNIETSNDDNILQVKSAGLLAFGQNGPITLQPGLSLGNPITLKKGSETHYNGTQYRMENVCEKQFELVSHREGRIISRIYMLKCILYPEEIQKRLLRTRTKYKIDNTDSKGARSKIIFDILTRNCEIQFDSLGLKKMFPDYELLAFVYSNRNYIEDTFQNPHFVQGMDMLTTFLPRIINELLLPKSKVNV